MSKRMRTLLISGVAVLVLAALLVVLLLLPAPEDSDTGTTTTTAPDTTVTLLDKTTTDDEDAITVQAVTITMGDTSYSLTANEDGDLLVDDYKDLPHNSSQQYNLSSELEQIVADRLIAESPANPQDYGFDTEAGAAAVVSVTYSDKATFAFEIGAEAPSGEGRYLREQGESAIYLYSTTSAEVFMCKSTAYLSTSPITTPSAKEGDDYASDTLVLRDAELSGSVRKQPISFQILADNADIFDSVTMSGYVTQRPYYRGVNADSVAIQSTTFSGFSATDVEKVYPTNADLKAYGLDKPYSETTFNLAMQHTVTETDEDGNETSETSFYNVFKYTIKLGDQNEDGLRYAVVYQEKELLPIVYLVKEANIGWATLQYDDIADTMLFFVYINYVDTMAITADGVETVFHLAHVEGETDNTKNLTVTAGGKTYDQEGFRLIYQGLMGILRSGTADTLPEGEPVLKVKTTANRDGVHNLDVELYRQSGSKYVVRHSDGEMYMVNAKDVESFLQDYQQYLQSE